MVPPKKKTVSRKRVLDLESSGDNSPQRSSWQAKYKELLPADSPKSRNGDGKTLGGLVGDYDSSSESDSESSRDSKTKPPEKVDPAPVTPQTAADTNGAQYQIPGSSWIECYDRNSGFPYYWNQVTNQVTWQPPPEYATLQLLRKQQALTPNDETTLLNSSPVQVKNQPAAPKQNKKYPWDGNSDSDEGEKTPIGDDSEPKLFPTDKKKSSKKLPGSRLLLTTEDGQEIYETSSLMTPLVPDTGPPGAEPPASNTPTANGTVDSKNDTKKTENHLELADKILAEIEKEVPPDFVKPVSRRPSSETKSSTSFALIASYGDDSDPEDVNDSPPKPPCLFPSVAQSDSPPVAPKALFPSVVEPTVEAKPPVVTVETPRRQLLVSNSPPAVLDPNLPDSSMTFKRKKRIEFATAPRADVVPKVEIASKSVEPLSDYTPVTEPTVRYNMEPGERRGFGFSNLEQKNSGDKKAVIQFVKAETFSLPTSLDVAKPQKEISPIPSQDLVDGAALLKEKLTFLGEGKEEVSAVQQMAIQLETLVSAWQSGALTPAYLSQWLGSRAVELSKNEQAAAPTGWTCEWEREAKRYCYRNVATGTLVWDYPDGNGEKTSPVQDSVQDEVEMELSDTPPRSSPHDLDTVPPPPPDISRCATPPPPPAPIITKCIEGITTSTGEDVCNIPPPPPPEENYPPPPPPEPEQPPPPGVDASGNMSRTQPPLPRLPPPDSPSNSRLGSPIGDASSNRKRCLTSELDSFYMDLAKLGDSDSVPTSDNDSPKPHTGSLEDAPKKSTISISPTSLRPPLPPEVPIKSRKYSPPPQLPTSSIQDNANKRRKKGKLAPGLTLKKKGVSTLVAKWQQVQEEARKDYSSDEENNDA